jgi:hypothetical protein
MRRALAVLAAGVSVFALGACEKPLPEVSVQTGTTYVSAPATRYCFTLAKGPAGCRVTAAEPHEVPVRAGAPIGIDVPQEVGGLWEVRLTAPDDPTYREKLTIPDTTHLSLTPQFGTSGRLNIDVVSAGAIGDIALEAGRWRFVLVERPTPES